MSVRRVLGSLTEGRLSTVDLLVSSENIAYIFYKTSYLNKEVNCT
jgi:hypothetical protein